MLIGVTSIVVIGKLSSPRFFVLHLDRLEGSGLQIRFARSALLEGFETAWNRGTFWSVIVSATAASLLSYWISRRIMEPLTQLEEIGQKFAEGKLDERLPPSDIPEFNRLGANFNHMAASLENIEQRRRELITDLTHELRTPLTVMRGYLEELADERIQPTPEIYDRLMQETNRLQRLVNDMQELSKAEAGYLIINLQPINLYPLLKALVEKFADRVYEDAPQLELNCYQQLPLVLVDPDRIEQVLVNLIGNALNYTDAGSIKITAWAQTGMLWVSVTDTGNGIAPQDLPHVFERFWRGADSVRRNARGTGVGLAISQRLIQLQGGKMEVESELGKGSTFRFCLPFS
jgi:signal transduction histidine kinase